MFTIGYIVKWVIVIFYYFIFFKASGVYMVK
jgi:hypothetical protein